MNAAVMTVDLFFSFLLLALIKVEKDHRSLFNVSMLILAAKLTQFYLSVVKQFFFFFLNKHTQFNCINKLALSHIMLPFSLPFFLSPELLFCLAFFFFLGGGGIINSDFSSVTRQFHLCDSGHHSLSGRLNHSGGGDSVKI